MMLAAMPPLAQEDGQALLERSCTKCHSLTATMAQHNSRERWSEVVDAMAARGAEVTDEEIDKIIDYLVKVRGPKVKVNKATAGELAGALAVPDSVAAAVVEYREKHGAFKSLDDLKKAPALAGKDVDSKKDGLDFTVDP
jgi:competence protein ComEA